MESRQQLRQQELAGHGRLCLLLLWPMLLLAGTLCHAQDRAQESSAATNTAGICRFAVALPELEGPLTLGIFSPDGKLSRLLYRDAAIDSIPAGLNGLLISWDGKDDAGLPVPPGIYHARGLVHGKIAASALTNSEADWHDSRLHESNTPSNNAMLPAVQKPIPQNQITVTAARDALRDTRPELSIQAVLLGNQIIITAGGLPIFSIPLDAPLPPDDKQSVELRQGKRNGSAELILISPTRKTSYLLSGLDQLVPLDAGALPMPPEHFIPDSASSDAGTPRP